MPKNEGFPLLSGHLSLDLVNTEIVRRGVRHDLLVTEEDFVDWIQSMQGSGSLAEYQMKDDYRRSEVLQALLPMRTFLRSGFEQIADGNLPNADWQGHLEDLILKAPFCYKIISGDLIPISVGNPVDGLLSLIAFDALQIFASGDLLQLRRCANPDCVLMFMDSSGRRKWCSMQICGNRKKVARHQSRHGSKE